ncbi:hypothetical protein ASO20_02655 [Mycoplasma sp. (ex Biomphalaria glabrata)]|uniref:4Fe-4S cluster-binding domain-containing protein n=1 Tax=Mycoplasma sp. (ex Biomphalaria glabrata) TaxID=1749074 RepID=UPI00073A6BAA|nr:4Fe-4S cluster-binding domain-containing protein [Mycoplasma sp. (ex Biomphalaria glabrata)]ALV23536.1 hypothetical protein ASO20_02655 [Mycoplasma sp. (ex Biomphalaria glabrata)]
MENYSSIKLPIFHIETFGAVDGPGIRLIIFTQGCGYRCLFCHNPESWSIEVTKTITPEEILKKFKRNREFYDANSGGVTFSGGEPTLHIKSLIPICKLLKENNIHVAIDTAAMTYTDANQNRWEELIKYVDLFILDIKHLYPSEHKIITGVDFNYELSLLKFLEEKKHPYWLNQVYLNTYMDDKYFGELGKLLTTLNYCKRFQILPYHDLALPKYQNLHIDYPGKHLKVPTSDEIKHAMAIINKHLK